MKGLDLLVIDDNEKITTMLQELFNVNGHNCEVANDGRNGLSLIKEKKFDAVILDMAMPKFSGIDVIEQLEKDNMLKNNKIIILTAVSIENKMIDEILKKGVFTFLTKPVKSEVLLSTIENLK